MFLVSVRTWTPDGTPVDLLLLTLAAAHTAEATEPRFWGRQEEHTTKPELAVLDRRFLRITSSGQHPMWQ